MDNKSLELENILQECEEIKKQLLNRNVQQMDYFNMALTSIQKHARNVIKQFNRELQQINLNRHIISSQEEEYKRITREIHDGPAQTMSNLILHLELYEQVKDSNQEEAAKELTRVGELGRETMLMMRSFLREFRPMALDDLGLIPAINRYLEQFKKDTGINLIISLDETLNFTKEMQINLYRIIQESLHNIRKHSQAKNVTIELEKVDQLCYLTIKDDGKGFSLHADFEGHFGLINLRERMGLVNGTFKIKTEPGKGCEITCSFAEA
ncbi:MAG: sensor histidine kinase [Candidatus Wallbacteria bacterium]|nr:sensor histidine kinase [Candidatus Wallbacteria bacterium]